MISLEEIKKEIEERKKELVVPPIDENGLNYCRDYLNKNRIYSVDQFVDIDIWECLKCLYYVKTKGTVSIDECNRLIELLKSKISDLGYYELTNVLDLIFIISGFNEDDIVFRYINEKSDDKAEVIAKYLDDDRIVVGNFSKSSTFYVSYKTILSTIRDLNNYGDINELFDFMRNNTEIAAELISYYKVFRHAENDMERLKNSLANYSGLTKSLRKQVISSYYKKYYSEADIMGEISTIQEYVNDESNNHRDKAKKNNKMISGYNRAIQLLEAESSNDEIRKVREIVRSIADDDIKRKVLLYINEHNKDYYSRLNEELNELKGNSINLYFGVFAKYKIKMSPNSIREYLHHSLVDLEFIISRCLRCKFEESEILFILKHSTRIIVEQTKKYIELGYLTTSFLRKNMAFFSKDCDYFSKYNDSLNLLNKYGINPQMFCNDPLILILDHELFESNLSLLEEYDCIKLLKNASNYSFLLDRNLAFKLDKMIEFGYYDFLGTNIDILNFDSRRFLRFDLLNKMNMPVTDIDGFMEVIETDRFIVDDNDIEDYLLDVSKYHDDSFYSLEDIENNKINSLIVSINGELLSYPKIKRGIKEGKSIKDAVCFGKYFTEDEYYSFINGSENVY